MTLKGGDLTTAVQPEVTANPAGPIGLRRRGRQEAAKFIGPVWIVSVVRVGLALVVCFQLTYAAENYFSMEPGVFRRVFPASVFNLAVAAAFLGLSLFRGRFFRYWKPIALAACVLVTAGMTWASLIVRQTEPLFVSQFLFVAGTCSLLPWETQWQSALTVSSVAAIAINMMIVPAGDAFAAYRWLGIGSMALISYLCSHTWTRWLATLSNNQRRLRDQIADRDKIMAERERAEKRLRESESKLRKIFEASPDSISINRMSDGRYIDVNNEFQSTGYSKAEAVGSSIPQMGIFANKEQHRKFVNLLRAKGVVRNFEVDFRMKDGSIAPCIISGTVIELDGAPCVLSVTSSIARLKRTERDLIAAREAALAASHAKSEFLSSMSHEIRTPMNAILGMADLMSETPLNPEQRRYVDTMTSNGNALLDLINGILDLAKIEAGRLHLETTAFDLEEVTEHVVDTLGVRAHEKRLELAVRIPPDVPLHLLGDPLRVRQVLINLVGNAIKFTEEGEVALTVENEPEAREPGWLRFSVADTGIGIPTGKIETIFETFTQADSSTSRRYGGSGLGLSIAKRLIEAMGGRIWVESVAGKGSTFHFTAHFTVQSGAPKAALPASVMLAGMRVLIVDDNATNRLILREILRSQGAEVSEVEGGEWALAELALARQSCKPYRLILLDCRMPGMDGFQVAERLRREPGGSDAIILMLTSDDLSPKLARLRDLGLDAYVVKPIKRSELLRAIATVISGRTKPIEGKPAPVAEVEKERKLRILLADDSPDNRLLVRAYLRSTPHALEIAENGAIAFAKFVSGDHFDLVLMDVQMPVMDGYTAVRKMRQWEREHALAPTPIIALTASALEQGVRESIEVGCTAHLAKPIKKATLLEAIRQFTADSAVPAGSAPAGRMVVEADPDLRELIPEFLARKRGDLDAIAGALKQHDFAALAAFGHRIKGEGGGFGFDAISKFGAEIEQAARGQDAPSVQKHLHGLTDYLDRVQVVFREAPAAAAPGRSPANGGQNGREPERAH